MLDDQTAVIPVITATVYTTRTRRFYNAVNRVRAFVARRLRALDAPVRRSPFMQQFLVNLDANIRRDGTWLDARAEAVHRWVATLEEAHRYGRTAKHKRKLFATDPVTLKLQRQRFYTKTTPPEKRVYQDEDSRFEGLLQRTRTWQDLHQAGSVRR